MRILRSKKRHANTIYKEPLEFSKYDFLYISIKYNADII